MEFMLTCTIPMTFCIKGDAAKEMYFIAKGSLTLYVPARAP